MDFKCPKKIKKKHLNYDSIIYKDSDQIDFHGMIVVLLFAFIFNKYFAMLNHLDKIGVQSAAFNNFGLGSPKRIFVNIRSLVLVSFPSEESNL